MKTKLHIIDMDEVMKETSKGFAQEWLREMSIMFNKEIEKDKRKNMIQEWLDELTKLFLDWFREENE